MKPVSLTASLPVDVRVEERPIDYAVEAQIVGELIARAAIVVLFTMMAVRFGTDFVTTGRITGLFLLLSEAVVVVLTVVRRSAVLVDRTLSARLLMTVSMAGPPLLRPAMVAALASESITVALSCVGLAIVIAGKVTLGRSFALLPANRGIVSTGLYRFVRHPIYMGYLVAHVAYLLANPSLWNIAVLVIADAVLLARAVREEETLATDPAYREYQTRVRWRVAPGLF